MKAIFLDRKRSGQLFTQGLIQTMVSRNEWVSGCVCKRVDLVR